MHNFRYRVFFMLLNLDTHEQVHGCDKDFYVSPFCPWIAPIGFAFSRRAKHFDLHPGNQD
jgi:DUF1365 family protein